MSYLHGIGNRRRIEAHFRLLSNLVRTKRFFGAAPSGITLETEAAALISINVPVRGTNSMNRVIRGHLDGSWPGLVSVP
jgi:hypothetical protein